MKIRVIAPPERNPLLVGFESVPGKPSTVNEVVVLGKSSTLCIMEVIHAIVPGNPSTASEVAPTYAADGFYSLYSVKIQK